MKSLKENFQKAHIVIIGSGIIGKFNALELSELGFQVTIIDPAQHQNSCLLYTSPSPRDA